MDLSTEDVEEGAECRAGASVCAACARKTTRRASRIPGTRPWGAAVAPKAARGRGTDASARRRNFVPRRLDRRFVFTRLGWSSRPGRVARVRSKQSERPTQGGFVDAARGLVVRETAERRPRRPAYARRRAARHAQAAARAAPPGTPRARRVTCHVTLVVAAVAPPHQFPGLVQTPAVAVELHLYGGFRRACRYFFVNAGNKHALPATQKRARAAETAGRRTDRRPSPGRRRDRRNRGVVRVDVRPRRNGADRRQQRERRRARARHRGVVAAELAGETRRGRTAMSPRPTGRDAHRARAHFEAPRVRAPR